jgi:hypothetical protein
MYFQHNYFQYRTGGATQTVIVAIDKMIAASLLG